MSDTERVKLFKLYKTVGKTKVWQIKNAIDASPFFFASGLEVDVDGAPNAYAPIGTVGPLDFLANANSDPKNMKGRWCGIVTDSKGIPVKQTDKQPFPGYHISTTTLVDNNYKETDPNRFIDATKIPYIALPPAYFSSTGLKLGDFALVINGNNGKSCFAVFADTKFKANLGEASARTAEQLGLLTDLRWWQKRNAGNKTAKPPGASSGIITLVFPGSGSALGYGQGQSKLTEDAVQEYGKMCLHRYAIFDHDDMFALSYYKDYPNFAKALERNGYMFTCREKQDVSSMMLNQWTGRNKQ